MILCGGWCDVGSTRCGVLISCGSPVVGRADVKRICIAVDYGRLAIGRLVSREAVRMNIPRSAVSTSHKDRIPLFITVLDGGLRAVGCQIPNSPKLV